MSEHKLIKAYNDMMEHLYEAMDETLHSFADALDIAKEKTNRLGGYTQDEINKIADYVSRDVDHAVANVPAEKASNSLSEWLKFDIELIENFALDAFMDIADKTRVALAKLDAEAKQYHPYRSGDITGPGTLVCDQCQKHIAFKSTSVVPDCPACGAKSFSRV